MALPTAGAVSFTLGAQFARSPFSATSKPPRTQRSIWPTRKLSAWPMNDAPLAGVISCLPALLDDESCHRRGAAADRRERLQCGDLLRHRRRQSALPCFCRQGAAVGKACVGESRDQCGVVELSCRHLWTHVSIRQGPLHRKGAGC